MLNNEAAVDLAKKMMKPKSVLSTSEYRALVEYVSDNPKLKVKDIIEMKVKRVNSPEYTRVLNKYVSSGVDEVTATRILDCIDTTGICSYANIANIIVYNYLVS